MKNIMSLGVTVASVSTFAALATAMSAGSASAAALVLSSTATTGTANPTISGPTIINSYDFDTTFPTPTPGSANLANTSVFNSVAAPLNDTTQFFVVGKGAPAGGNGVPESYTINFTNTSTGLVQFGLYWGSIDEENSISFYTGLNGTGTLIGTITGSQVADPAAGFINDPIDNRYVVIGTSLPYASAVFSTSKIAFESDNWVTAVPEPTTMAGLAVAGGVGAFLKRRQKRQAAQA